MEYDPDLNAHIVCLLDAANGYLQRRTDDWTQAKVPAWAEHIRFSITAVESFFSYQA